jgi:phosphatidylinositol alpha-1,6-mannosyltransferase
VSELGRRIGVLGVFPALTGEIGGIQTVGRFAWQVISSQHADAVLLHYGSGGSVLGAAGTTVVDADSKHTVVAAALRLDIAPRLVVFGHLSLLRLVPFLDLSGARVVAFLFGIEAWKRLGIISRRILRRVDMFLPISDHTWHRFAAANPSLAHVDHRTVWPGAGSPLDAAAPAPQDPPATLMIGRLARGEGYKGHREMIDAWPLVLERIPRAELWIAGDGDLRPTIHEQVQRLGLHDHVRFWGQVSEETKEELLARCRCLAMPSHGEGFGLVYVEAMRMGRPCLVSLLDAGREVVNPPEAGLMVDRDAPKELADAVCRLLTSGQAWDAWSRAARHRYETLFSAAHFQERLIHALSEA